MTGVIVLQRYADHLARHLVGPYKRRCAIIDEVMDGLLCAVEDNVQQCPDPEEAARRVVEEWGSPGELARAYNDATLRIGANRVSLRAVCLLPLLAAAWTAALLGGAAGSWGYRSPVVMTGLCVVTFGGVLSLAGAVTGLRKGSGLRAAASQRDETPTSGTIAAILGMLCVLAALIVMLLNLVLSHPESLDWPMVSVPVALTIVSGAYFALCLKRFLSVIRGTGRW